MGVSVYMDSTNHDQAQAAKSTIDSSEITLLTKQTVMDWKWKNSYQNWPSVKHLQPRL